ncbi:MAG TPA: hypothetical protein P5232_01720 [Candidatus Moranbacteria bacterium]|nr:hypothetical protein [Candidatus Moranbacteria bacterium]
MKKNKKKFLILAVIFLTISVGIFLYKDYIAKGATYGWAQSSWAGGVGATHGHTAEQADPGAWTKYSAKDANANAGATVSISSEVTAITHTLDADFAGGTGTGVLKTGDQLSLDLP